LAPDLAENGQQIDRRYTAGMIYRWVQLNALLAPMAAAGAPTLGSTNRAPASRPASPQADASSTSITTRRRYFLFHRIDHAWDYLSYQL